MQGVVHAPAARARAPRPSFFWVVAVVAAGTVVGIAVAVVLSPKADSYTTTVGAGLAPRMDVEQVADLARDQIASMATAANRSVTPDIMSVTAVAEADLESILPHLGNQDSGSDRLVWVVKATGWFVARLGPPGRLPDAGADGYLVIDDATGHAVGMGVGRR
jgi:hypothetical protein